MSQFLIHTQSPDGSQQRFIYDSAESTLTTQNGKPVVPFIVASNAGKAITVSRDAPVGKSRTPKTLKISLGLSCNYECSYCSQRFVPHADETNKGDIEPFLEGLDEWIKEPPECIEFWGGEPLVYWKTLKPLAEALRGKWGSVPFQIITNGSLLTPEINIWLDDMGFQVGLSHDGPGYHARGVDPLDDPDKRANILDLWLRLRPKGRMSINAMMHKDNLSRAAVQKFLTDVFGEEVGIGEGSFIDPYDEGGLASSLLNEDKHMEFRRVAFNDLRQGFASKFHIAGGKIQDFIHSLRTRRPLTSIGQKCAMDKTENIAVDLKGNVLTCQNVSATSIAPNGESHKIGHVSDFDNIKLKTSTHWSRREECPTCPVIQLCKGSCMFLEGPLWEAGCNNAYSDNIAFFAAAIEFLTGCVPVYIDGPQRDDRKDIFGLLRMDQAKPSEPQPKPFPIRVVTA